MGATVCLAFSATEPFSELLVETALGLVRERQRGFAHNDGRGLDAHFFAFEVALECIKEETIMGDGVPVDP